MKQEKGFNEKKNDFDKTEDLEPLLISLARLLSGMALPVALGAQVANSSRAQNSEFI